MLTSSLWRSTQKLRGSFVVVLIPVAWTKVANEPSLPYFILPAKGSNSTDTTSPCLNDSLLFCRSLSSLMLWEMMKLLLVCMYTPCANQSPKCELDFTGELVTVCLNYITVAHSKPHTKVECFHIEVNFADGVDRNAWLHNRESLTIAVSGCWFSSLINCDRGMLEWTKCKVLMRRLYEP